ncbi:MAG: SigE family RNA polymerase sigma factor [Nocardioidaceae bacterium]
MEKAPASGAPTWVRPDFEEFVAARSSRLLRTAYLLTHDRGLAEDLVQTALSKAWFAWGRVDNDPEPYVRRILVNTYASWWRRRWNGEEPTDALPDTGSSGHDESSAARHDLWDAMARLPKRQRAVVVLRYFEDLSEAQAAEVLGCSVGTVKSQTSRALAKLRIDPALEPTDRPTAGPTDRPAAPATPEGTTR